MISARTMIPSAIMAGRRGQMMLSLWHHQKYYSAQVLAWRFRVLARNDWTVTDYHRGGGGDFLASFLFGSESPSVVILLQRRC